MIKTFKRFWESPTFMTWGSFLSKSVGTIIVLALVLKEFSSAEVALWFLFMTIFNLQNIIDLGFNPTFSRAISYSTGNKDGGNTLFEKLHLKDVIPTMVTTYNYLSLIFLIGLSTLGTFALIKSVNQTEDINASWISWVIVCLMAFMNLRSNKYNAYLIGMNQVALVRRWEILFSILRLITQLSFLAMGANILMLVIATHIWTLLSILRNKFLSYRLNNQLYKQAKKEKFNKEIFLFMWPSAWRSGLGMALGTGVIQVSGLIYAQIGTAAEVATFLLAVRIMEAIVGFSQAPLYSKLPYLAKCYANDDIHQIKQVSRRGMALSLYSFSIACIVWGICGEYLLKLIDSDTPMISGVFWALFSIAHLMHRYGAMHVQLYSISNHIIWHKADGISGIIYIIVIMITYETLGIYSILVAMLIGYIGFYTWYASMHSYRKFKLHFWRDDKQLVFSVIPLVILLAINI